MVLLVLFLAIFGVAVVSAQLFTSGCKKTSVAFLLAVLGCLVFVNEAQAITVQVGANNNAIPVSVATKADTVFIAKTDTVTVLKRDTVYINNCDKETVMQDNNFEGCGVFVSLKKIQTYNFAKYTSLQLVSDESKVKAVQYAKRLQFYNCGKTVAESDDVYLVNTMDTPQLLVSDCYITYLDTVSMNVLKDTLKDWAKFKRYNSDYNVPFFCQQIGAENCIKYNLKCQYSIHRSDYDGGKIRISYYINNHWITLQNFNGTLYIPLCCDSVRFAYNDISSRLPNCFYLTDLRVAKENNQLSVSMTVADLAKHLCRGELIISSQNIDRRNTQEVYANELDECSASNGELQEQVDELQNEIELLKERIEELESVSAETTSINLVKSSASTPRKYIDALGRDIVNDNFKGVKIPVY